MICRRSIACNTGINIPPHPVDDVSTRSFIPSLQDAHSLGIEFGASSLLSLHFNLDLLGSYLVINI